MAFLALGFEIAPRSRVLLMALGEALLVFNDVDEARGVIERAFALPSAPKRLTPARLKYASLQLRKRGFPEAARHFLAIALGLHPDDVTLLDALAKREVEAGNNSAAVELLQRAEALSSSPMRLKRLRRLREQKGWASDQWQLSSAQARRERLREFSDDSLPEETKWYIEFLYRLGSEGVHYTYMTLAPDIGERMEFVQGRRFRPCASGSRITLNR